MMEVTIEEILKILNSGNRELMADYLRTHSFKSREECALREQLREMEYSLRMKGNLETVKTRKILNTSRRVKMLG